MGRHRASTDALNQHKRRFRKKLKAILKAINPLICCHWLETGIRHYIYIYSKHDVYDIVYRTCASIHMVLYIIPASTPNKGGWIYCAVHCKLRM